MHRLDTFPGRDLIGQYRQIFSSQTGLVVLEHMLFELGVFFPVTSEDDVTLRNYGTRLLEILAGEEIDGHNIQEFAKRIMRQPIPKDVDES